MMLAQCGAASCDWRATPAHEEAPARGEPGLPLGCAVTYGQRHKGKERRPEADACGRNAKPRWIKAGSIFCGGKIRSADQRPTPLESPVSKLVVRRT
jgi:hypothetical protein